LLLRLCFLLHIIFNLVILFHLFIFSFFSHDNRLSLLLLSELFVSFFLEGRQINARNFFLCLLLLCLLLLRFDIDLNLIGFDRLIILLLSFFFFSSLVKFGLGLLLSIGSELQVLLLLGLVVVHFRALLLSLLLSLFFLAKVFHFLLELAFFLIHLDVDLVELVDFLLRESFTLLLGFHVLINGLLDRLGDKILILSLDCLVEDLNWSQFTVILLLVIALDLLHVKRNFLLVLHGLLVVLLVHHL